MKTNDKPSTLINQAITNLYDVEGSTDVQLELYELLKKVTLLELVQAKKQREKLLAQELSAGLDRFETNMNIALDSLRS